MNKRNGNQGRSPLEAAIRALQVVRLMHLIRQLFEDSWSWW